jgi:ribosomal protein L16 Arg81 hydroxylase
MAKIKIGGKEFEVSNEVITKSIEENAEIIIDATDLSIRTAEEETAFVGNLKTTYQTAGVEVAVKEAKRTLGLEFTGRSVDSLIEAVKVKTLEDAKIEPEAKVKELMKDIDTLKATIGTVTAEKEQIQNQFHGFKTESIVNNTIASLIPENTALPKDDMTLLLKSKLKFEVDESNRVIVRGLDGEIMKNATTLDPLQAKDVVTSFFNDNPIYIKGASGGAGGADSGGAGGKITVEAFVEKKAKEGVSHTDPKFLAELQELQKQGLIAD